MVVPFQALPLREQIHLVVGDDEEVEAKVLIAKQGEGYSLQVCSI